jgi:hypothetical protein
MARLFCGKAVEKENPRNFGRAEGKKNIETTLRVISMFSSPFRDLSLVCLVKSYRLGISR